MDKNLTAEQKNILFKEGTEAPGSSSLNYEIGKVRAFVVALLQDVNDSQAAAKVNDILVSAE